jgi:Leucine-rich repeat (LRR) protein
LQFSFSSIKYAAKLSSFDLSNTGLFKLDGIQESPALSALDISRNNFKSIPQELFELKTLEQLDMGSNDFQSPLPTNVGELKKLRFLSCSRASLQGNIPSSIGQLTDLVHLNLEENNLTGSLPSEIEYLENLAFLDLSGQSLQGQLPSLKTLRELRRLDRELEVQCVGYVRYLI